MRNEKIKLGNFGFQVLIKDPSRQIKREPEETPCYFSPELMDGRLFETKSDIW